MTIHISTFEDIGALGATPTPPAANYGRLYTILDLGFTQLHFRSDSGVDYALTPPPGAVSPWSRVAPDVFLANLGDKVTIGAAAHPAGRSFAVLASDTNGMQVQSGAANDVAIDLRQGAQSFMRATVQIDGKILWGTGLIAQDVALFRTSTNTLALSDGTGGVTSGTFVPSNDGFGSLGIPSARWRGVTASTRISVYNLNTDVAGASSMGVANLTFSPGTGAADVGFQRSGVVGLGTANTIEVTDGAAGSGNIQPLVSGSGKIGTSGGASAKAFQSVSATTEFLVAPTATDTYPTTRLGSAALKFGTGGLVTDVDVGIERGPNNTIVFNNGALLSGNLAPKVANSGTVGIFATPWASQTSGSAGFYVVQAAADSQPAANLASDNAGGKLLLGPGGLITAPDTRIQRTATTTITIDNNSNGRVDILPALDGTNNAIGSKIGSATLRMSAIYSFEVNTGDVVFTDEACVVCGQQFEEGDDLVMRVIKVHTGPQGRQTRTVPAHHGCK